MLAQVRFQTALTMGFALLALSISACTKSKEVKSMVSPDAYVAKADYEGKIFSLVRGIEEADSNNVVFAVPGFSTDYGLVTVRITETEVQFIEHYNLRNKTNTQSILASYEIKGHFDIQRELNDFGETTHKIIENTERPWHQRKFMRVDWSKPTNGTSKLASSTGDVGATTENVVLLSDPINENGHISWLTEFSVEGDSGWWGAQPNSRVVARTHLMPLVSTDFEPVNYRNQDFAKFGYFTTTQEIENPEKGPLDSELENVTFANVFNVCESGRKDANGKPLSCSTGKIVWHLTKGYPEKYLAVTRQAVIDWNNAFKKALGRSDDVVVLNEAKAVDIVDPRFNTIAFYGAKSPGGLLGVAQKASNPITGEVIAARATMFDDGVRYMLGLVDDIVTMILNDDEVRGIFLATDVESKARVESLFGTGNLLKGKVDPRTLRLKLGLSGAPSKTQSFISRNSKSEIRKSIAAVAKKATEGSRQSLARKKSVIEKAPDLFAPAELLGMGGSVFGFDKTFGLLGAKAPVQPRFSAIGGLEHLHDIGTSLREERARLLNQAATGVHGAELVEEATLRYIKKILAANPDAKDFRDQVEAIKRDVEQNTYYTTLLHEMGHTFGLRHNFHASADEKHYHPEFHRIDQLLTAEAGLSAAAKTVAPSDRDPYMFSSVMDYGGDFYSQQGGLAPYDIAAIRYAYNRSIDKKTDETVTSGYKFCTDHQVNESILCRRFDKGRNVSEITFNLIEDYQTNWLLSHLRRDRANFDQRARSYPMNALVRYFAPIRQVMDEFIYALIDSKSVAANENECDVDYWRASVDAGEIVNICNFAEAEQVGVDPTRIETFEAGLFGPGGLRKNPEDYTPNGLADLLFANLIAKQFFTEVLGSTEPGTYLAEPITESEFQLQKISVENGLDKGLEAFAESRGLPMSDELMTQMKSLVGEIKPGRYGKPFMSKWDDSGPFVRQQTIGAFWDKYIAMIALGLTDMGVSKYDRNSMTGNAGSFPQTREFSRGLIKSMITKTDRLVTVPLTTPLGVLPAKAEPSANLDTQVIATITALTDFISQSDPSMAEQLRVCSVREAGCLAAPDQSVAEFTTSSGQDVFRATQTRDKTSISYDLVSAAAKISAEQKTWIENQRTAADVATRNILKIQSLSDVRTSLEKNLKALEDPNVAQVIEPLLSAEENVPSMWNLVNVLATQSEQVPLFLTINLSDQASEILNASAQILGQSLQALDPTGQCRESLPKKDDTKVTPSSRLPGATQNQPPVVTEPSPPGATEPLPPGVRRLRSLIGGTKSSFGLQNRNSPAAGKVEEVAAEKVNCAAIAAKLSKYTAVATEFEAFATEIGTILNDNIQAKASPLRVRQLTDQLSSAETNILLIRRVFKASDLD